MPDSPDPRTAKELRLTVDIQRSLDRLIAEYGDDALARTPVHEIAEWIADGLTHPVRALTVWEMDALRAAIHEVSGPCWAGRLDQCFDNHHEPPIDLEQWWPPLNAETVRLA